MALEQRVGGAEFGEDLVVGHHRCSGALGRAARPSTPQLQRHVGQALEALESRAYRARANPAAQSCVFGSNAWLRGDR